MITYDNHDSLLHPELKVAGVDIWRSIGKRLLKNTGAREIWIKRQKDMELTEFSEFQ